MHRKGKKALQGKKSRKGEDEPADTSSSAAQVEARSGTRLKPKQKKKLLKEVSCSSQTVTSAVQDLKTESTPVAGQCSSGPVMALYALPVSGTETHKACVTVVYQHTRGHPLQQG